MGKRRERIDRHKQSLGDQLENPETYGVRTKPRLEKRRKAGNDSEEDEEFVPAALSNRILEEARAQQEEVAIGGAHGAQRSAREALTTAMQSIGAGATDSDDDREAGDEFSDPGSDWGEEWESEINAEDEAALAAFMAPGAKDHRQKTLTDVIMEKIRAKQEESGVAPRHRCVSGPFLFCSVL